MEVNQASVALNQTVAQLQGGVLRPGVESAVLAVTVWEQTSGATSVAELALVAENLTAPRTRLAPEDPDSAKVGRLLRKIGGRAREVVTIPYGLPASLMRLSLATGGRVLEGQGVR